MVAGASRGLGFAVAQALAAEGAHGLDRRRATRRRSARRRAKSSATGATVLGDAGGRASRPTRCSAGPTTTIEQFGGVDLLFTNSGGPPAGRGAVVRRRGVAGRGGPAAVQHAADGARGRAVDEGARRRRDPGVHLVVGQGADSEPRAVDRAARVGVGARQDAGARARAAKIRVNQIMPGRIDTDRVRQLDEINAQEAGHLRRRGQGEGDGGDSAGPLRRADEFGRVGAFLLSDAAVVHDRRDVQVDGGLIRSVSVRLPVRGSMSDAEGRCSRGRPIAWLRDHATKTAFVRRSVSRFMPGEQIEDALRAAAELKPQGITTILTQLGREPDERRGGRGGHAALPRRARQVAAAGLDAQISVKPTQLGLDLDRSAVRAQPRSADRAGRAARQLPLDRHGELAVRRSDARAVPPDAREDARASASRCRRTCIAREGRRVADPARRRRSASSRARISSRRTSRSRRRRTWTRTSTSCARGCCRPTRSKPGALLHIATHDIALADRLAAYIAEHKVPASAYEFAMLYGIQRGQQLRLARAGQAAARAHQLRRVLVPVVHAPARRAAGERVVRDQEYVAVVGFVACRGSFSPPATPPSAPAATRGARGSTPLGS